VPDVELAVNGTLMRGLSLNRTLVIAGATFVREARTAPVYRLWTIDDRHPAMIRTTDGRGTSVEVEVWRVPFAGITDILLHEPPGLAVGKITLDSGEQLLGVVAEPALVEGHPEITAFGGWRAYLAARGKEETP
jgi:carbamate kinase